MSLHKQSDVNDRLVTERSRVLLIGIGNEYRSDDGVGLVATRKLRALPNAKVIEESGEGMALMEVWKGADTVILLDAVSSSAAPGTIHRFEVHAEPIPTKVFNCSTHAFSIAEAIELARTLNQLPPRMIVYGIEGKNFAAGVGLSSEVEKAVQDVVERVLQDIHTIRY